MSPQQPPEGRPETLGVVVCTYTEERLDQVVDAVASVRRQTRAPDRVLVVVDGDEELAGTVGAALPGEEILCLGRNSGVSVARNRGVAALDTDLVAFLDDDAVARPAWLAELVGPLADPRVMGVSGSSEGIFGRRHPAWLPDEFLWTVGVSWRGMPTEPARIRNFYGGCAVVRRSVFEAVDGFATDIGHREGRVGGGEEADFCLRASRAHPGDWFLFAPSAVVGHRVPPARLTLRYFLRRCFDEGVMKRQVSARLKDGALGAERQFALRLPAAAGRYLRTPSRRPAAGGVLLGVLAVLAGLLRGSVDTWTGGRR
ncbi:glycosyltransferase family 2 protein [Nocardioides donggukensis]|uniref:Glycosyltransferase family 2 protein n=1 Tax=Nocardioides donggukensis TaxID=2774019 RepID=A0A927K3E3_9ACTN|nr:glycosyltransferase family 2 protein [Nocardioides donggukensis]MBD8869389.1 glycosyltransferase family 2 protein [Nocardioides donggukensis]